MFFEQGLMFFKKGLGLHLQYVFVECGALILALRCFFYGGVLLLLAMMSASAFVTTLV